ncbi:Outer membrane protein OmpA [Lampropedia hyalina DSM 16112]|jgi:outer membrane protein OmpA-like peptidoglycan-associated protein|uniref:Outer membrane protein OmpA n=1 Tax=Lampropedia hyalina DSM 16112 TaxID=1122156 RepID=A0A1M5ETD2_9BURK|nr:OmpA family protein [Lampropedia hyalina]SHF82477.1 Outer membrane protein OmpA [Lampropedia hyalina DSM 16112]
MKFSPFAIAGIAAASLVLSGCATMSDTQRTTATGAGIGAVVGAIAGDGKGAAIGATLGGLGGYVWSQRMERQRAEVENAMANTGVVVTQTEDNRLKLDIPSDISFDTNRADIKAQFAPLLDQFAYSLRNNPNTDVYIIGHTDSTGNDGINNPLSQRRADSTRQYLVSQGVAPQRIQTAGRGSYEPVATNNTPEGRSRNRRVEIFVGERQQGGQ